MGTDIHWTMERRDPRTGEWDCVMADLDEWDRIRSGAATSQARNDALTHPALGLGRRSYGRFSLLSGLYCERAPEETLATPGIPEDAAPFTRAVHESSGTREAIGSLVLAHLEDAVRHGHPAIEGGDDRHIAEELLRTIREVVATKGPDGPKDVMLGYSGDWFSGISQPSNHERMVAAAKSHAYGPLRDEDIRLVFSYTS